MGEYLAVMLIVIAFIYLLITFLIRFVARKARCKPIPSGGHISSSSPGMGAKRQH